MFYLEPVVESFILYIHEINARSKNNNYYMNYISPKQHTPTGERRIHCNLVAQQEEQSCARLTQLGKTGLLCYIDPNASELVLDIAVKQQVLFFTRLAKTKTYKS